MNAPFIPNARPAKRNEAIDQFCEQLSMSEQVRVLMNILGNGIHQPDHFLAALDPLSEVFDREYDKLANAAAWTDCDPEERKRHNLHVIERALADEPDRFVTQRVSEGMTNGR